MVVDGQLDRHFITQSGSMLGRPLLTQPSFDWEIWRDTIFKNISVFGRKISIDQGRAYDSKGDNCLVLCHDSFT